ncbi:hypothetical protein [Agrococcus baldri]|uniref:Uncharacterized protein n=1 Tax=Agrococcus baldri TaxID=153730 RepID=A0AA87RJT8_9MICO|nr:hypothetical protein [Agrococcus baldri]GEK80583.1 hypothetical protein ABA31_19340 [Agrococcus baldri]
MRRRAKSGDLPARYTEAGLPAWIDDYLAPISNRVDAWNAWTAQRAAWADERRVWVATNCPALADHYLHLEPSLPDEPFDYTAV